MEIESNGRVATKSENEAYAQMESSEMVFPLPPDPAPPSASAEEAEAEGDDDHPNNHDDDQYDDDHRDPLVSRAPQTADRAAADPNATKGRAIPAAIPAARPNP